MMLNHNQCKQDEYPNSINTIQRVQIEPERTGWARLADIVRLKHTEKVADMKEDIDTLLVFVSLSLLRALTLPNVSLGRFILSCDHGIYYRIIQESPATAGRHDSPDP